MNQKDEQALVEDYSTTFAAYVHKLTQHEIFPASIIIGQHDIYSFGAVDGPITLFRMLWCFTYFLKDKAFASGDKQTSRHLQKVLSIIEDGMEEDEVTAMQAGPHSNTHINFSDLAKKGN